MEEIKLSYLILAFFLIVLAALVQKYSPSQKIEE